jgi:hypothetical protein
MRVELKGVHTVEAKGKTYHYAWRGGRASEANQGHLSLSLPTARLLPSGALLMRRGFGRLS